MDTENDTETKTPVNKINPRYQLESVEETDPPEGMPDGDWCRYVIGQGNSKIVCVRSGSLTAVTRYAKTYAKELNERFTKGTSPYAQRSQKK